MTTEIALTTPNIPLNGRDRAAFDTVVGATLATVAASSARIYQHTFDLWAAWCCVNQADPLDLRPASVRDFLASRQTTKATRQRQLSALRKLARVLALDYTHPEYKAIHDALLLLKAPTDNLSIRERTRRALAPSAVWKVLNHWQGESLVAIRNRALFAVLFYTGIRRAELIALRWSEIDIEAGVIQVRHGKGDKAREVAVVGDEAVNALEQWQAAQTAAAGAGRVYVFCALAKGGKLAADQPMTARAINKLTDETAAATGVDFKPHDARRTLATDLLARGYSTADVQAQLGHANASTTIQGYGIAADARKRRARFETSY
ncbi:MAG: site-specific integrase [bacterium]|nr:site-specific integrase [bacterium]